MDESNNTPEVIDQNKGIIDTYIEPVRGLEALVQRTTILKTGAISTGNFQ
jgi:tetrahydromethanopterin S-methyltransferase subunit F